MFILLLALLSVLSTFIKPSGAYRNAVVQTGLDILIESNYGQFSGKKVIMLTNPTGITKGLDLGLDVMFESGLVDLVGVMGPEHGFRGTAQNGNGQATFVDSKTGLTVYDAYNVNSTVLKSYLIESGADIVVFDIQDVGARFYTYIWAMYDSMVAAALNNVSFVVLDRPNPLTGLNAFGPVLNQTYFTSYVGRRAIAQAHGMTVGELAKMFVGEGWIKEAAGGSDLKSLDVIQMKGWKRSMTFQDTGLPWVIPSPNLPTVSTAMIYPGTCMFEGTSISEGRGTTRPFETLGAPWTNESWVDTMRSLNIPFTNYRFQCFTPTASKFSGQVACGLQVYMDLNSTCDYQHFDPVYVGVALLWAAKHLYTNDTDASVSNNTQSFHWVYGGSSKTVYDIDVLSGSPLIRQGIEAGLSPEEIRDRWQEDLSQFKQRRERYLIY